MLSDSVQCRIMSLNAVQCRKMPFDVFQCRLILSNTVQCLRMSISRLQRGPIDMLLSLNLVQ